MIFGRTFKVWMFMIRSVEHTLLPGGDISVCIFCDLIFFFGGGGGGASGLRLGFALLALPLVATTNFFSGVGGRGGCNLTTLTFGFCSLMNSAFEILK